MLCRRITIFIVLLLCLAKLVLGQGNAFPAFKREHESLLKLKKEVEEEKIELAEEKKELAEEKKELAEEKKELAEEKKELAEKKKELAEEKKELKHQKQEFEEERQLLEEWMAYGDMPPHPREKRELLQEAHQMHSNFR